MPSSQQETNTIDAEALIARMNEPSEVVYYDYDEVRSNSHYVLLSYAITIVERQAQQSADSSLAHRTRLEASRASSKCNRLVRAKSGLAASSALYRAAAALRTYRFIRQGKRREHVPSLDGGCAAQDVARRCDR